MDEGVQEQEGFILVPVPAERVLDVYAFLARSSLSNAGSEGSVALDGPTGADPSAEAGWDAESTRRLITLLSRNAQLIVEYVAERGGEATLQDVSESAVADELTFAGARTPQAVAGMLTGVRRNSEHVRPDLEVPIAVTNGRIRIDPQFAELIKNVNWRRRLR